MDFLVTYSIYIILGIIALGFISGAIFYGFSTPIRAGISIIFLLVLYNFMFISENHAPSTDTLIVYFGIAVFVLYNLKQLGILSIVLLFISTSSSKSKVSTLENKECQIYYINTDILNLRKLPNIHSDKIGFIEKDTKVCVVKDKNSWSYIKNKGWVSHQYLTTTKPQKK